MHKGANVNFRNSKADCLKLLSKKNTSFEIYSLLIESGFDLGLVEKKSFLLGNIFRNCDPRTIRLLSEKGLRGLSEFAFKHSDDLDFIKYLFEKDEFKNEQDCIKNVLGNQRLTKEILSYLLEKTYVPNSPQKFTKIQYYYFFVHAPCSEELFIILLSHGSLDMSGNENTKGHPLELVSQKRPFYLPILQEFIARGTIWNVERHHLFPNCIKKSIETLVLINRFRVDPSFRVPKLLLYQIISLSTIF